MAIKIQKTAMLGAILGAATPWMLAAVSKVASLIPGVDVSLQSISIGANVSGEFAAGVSNVANQIFGLVPVTLPTIIQTAIGGAIFVTAGAWIADMLGLLKGSKMQRLTSTLVTAAVVIGAVMAMAIPFTITTGIILVVNSVILAWLWTMIDNQLKTNLIP